MNSIIRTNGLRNFNDNVLASMVSNWDDFFPSVFHGANLAPASRMPAVDIKETDTEYQVIADLPGISKDNLEVSLKDEVLNLTVHSKQEQNEESEGRIVRQERYQGTFHRSFKLNDTVDAENIQANYKDGVLTISVPKKEPVHPTQIEITTH